MRIWGVVIPPGYLRWAGAGAGVIVLGMLIATVVGMAGLFGASPEDEGATVRATVVTGAACDAPSVTETVTFSAAGDQHRARFDGCGHQKNERVEVTVPTGPLPNNLVVHASTAAVGDSEEGEGLALLLIVASSTSGAPSAWPETPRVPLSGTASPALRHTELLVQVQRVLCTKPQLGVPERGTRGV